MNLMYCGDANVVDGVLISLLSMVKNVARPFTVHLVTAGIETRKGQGKPVSPDAAQYLSELLESRSPGSSLVLYDITERFAARPPRANINSMFSPYCMLRLYTDGIEGIPDAVLYLDTDVVCRRDFSDVFDEDMRDYELAGVYDYYGRWWVHVNFPPRLDYMNSGVLLLNMARIRQTGLFERCRELCASRHMMMPDQTAINKLCRERKVLPRKYNEQRRLADDTALYHFSTIFRLVPFFHPQTVKPWDVERVHKVLHLHEFDDILEEYQRLAPELHGLSKR